jgi:predicted nuclease with TOPRIM domain
MPSFISTPEFWVTLLSLLGVSKIIEVSYTRFLNRGKNKVEYGMASLKFMAERMQAMENEMERQKGELASLKKQMDKLKEEHQLLNDTLYNVTVTVERHGDAEIIRRVREIPGVPIVNP